MPGKIPRSENKGAECHSPGGRGQVLEPEVTGRLGSCSSHSNQLLNESGICLCLDPDDGSASDGARAGTALSPDWLRHVDADGQLPANDWPHGLPAVIYVDLRFLLSGRPARSGLVTKLSLVRKEADSWESHVVPRI